MSKEILPKFQHIIELAENLIAFIELYDAIL
jgi:hypothetical protein